jgi:hypothetical protein
MMPSNYFPTGRPLARPPPCFCSELYVVNCLLSSLSSAAVSEEEGVINEHFMSRRRRPSLSCSSDAGDSVTSSHSRRVLNPSASVLPRIAKKPPMPSDEAPPERSPEAENEGVQNEIIPPLPRPQDPPPSSPPRRLKAIPPPSHRAAVLSSSHDRGPYTHPPHLHSADGGWEASWDEGQGGAEDAMVDGSEHWGDFMHHNEEPLAAAPDGGPGEEEDLANHQPFADEASEQLEVEEAETESSGGASEAVTALVTTEDSTATPAAAAGGGGGTGSGEVSEEPTNRDSAAESVYYKKSTSTSDDDACGNDAIDHSKSPTPVHVALVVADCREASQETPTVWDEQQAQQGREEEPVPVPVPEGELREDEDEDDEEEVKFFFGESTRRTFSRILQRSGDECDEDQPSPPPSPSPPCIRPPATATSSTNREEDSENSAKGDLKLIEGDDTRPGPASAPEVVMDE